MPEPEISVINRIPIRGSRLGYADNENFNVFFPPPSSHSLSSDNRSFDSAERPPFGRVDEFFRAYEFFRVDSVIPREGNVCKNSPRALLTVQRIDITNRTRGIVSVIRKRTEIAISLEYVLTDFVVTVPFAFFARRSGNIFQTPASAKFNQRYRARYGLRALLCPRQHWLRGEGDWSEGMGGVVIIKQS